jgi:RimJ/RimL family protein N-acetyltransferase
VVTLETDRLLLRPLHEGDLDQYAAMVGDAEVMRHIGTGQPLARIDAWRQMAMLLGHWQLRGYGLFAVEERRLGLLVGRVGLFNPEGWPGLEVGWLTARPCWGRGYATEAAQAVLRWAFLDLKHPHLISLIRPANAASIRVAEKLGERLQGRTVLQGNEVLVYGLGRDDWLASGGSSAGQEAN